MKITAIRDSVRNFKAKDGTILYCHEIDVDGCKEATTLLSWSDNPQFAYMVGDEVTGKVEPTNGGFKIVAIKSFVEQRQFIRMTSLGSATIACESKKDSPYVLAQIFFDWIISKEETQVAQASVKYLSESMRKMSSILSVEEMNEIMEENYKWLLG